MVFESPIYLARYLSSREVQVISHNAAQRHFLRTSYKTTRVHAQYIGDEVALCISAIRIVGDDVPRCAYCGSAPAVA
jgi:hypothetical protein